MFTQTIVLFLVVGGFNNYSPLVTLYHGSTYVYTNRCDNSEWPITVRLPIPWVNGEKRTSTTEYLYTKVLQCRLGGVGTLRSVTPRLQLRPACSLRKTCSFAGTVGKTALPAACTKPAFSLELSAKPTLLGS